LCFRLFLAALLLAPVAGAMEMDDMSQPLEWHFGGDVNYGKKFGDAATPNAFTLGKIDTMIHGRLSRTFSVLAEIVYEGEENFGFDIERVMLNFEPRSWFRLSIGRFHTPIGYWNTAYHHARWMYVTTEAPLLVRFEDEGGPLQAHTIGVLVHGSVPVGSMKLEYDFSVGNGRGPRADPPQNFTDVNEGKSVGGALHLEVGGLRFGVSGMIDSTTVTSGVDLSEQIGGADLHLRLGELEAIVEGAVIHHDLGGVSATNYGGYVQASYGIWEDVHLYGRGERFVRDSTEGYLNTPTTSSVLGGIRFDPIPSAAIKLEGGWEKFSGVEGATARGQVSWLF
jgi:hypothetical protein